MSDLHEEENSGINIEGGKVQAARDIVGHDVIINNPPSKHDTQWRTALIASAAVILAALITGWFTLRAQELSINDKATSVALENMLTSIAEKETASITTSTATRVIPTAIPAPPDIAPLIYEAAIREHSIQINPTFGLFVRAQQWGLGAPESDEFEFPVGDTTYVGQVYSTESVIAPKGNWAATRRRKDYISSDPVLAEFDLIEQSQYLLFIDPTSPLMQTAAQSPTLGFAVTRQFKAPIHGELYFIQRFQKGILYYSLSDPRIYEIPV